LDADNEGFLRSGTPLIQTIGRAARNVNAEVILYADKATESMQRATEETNRRRERQLASTRTHRIKPGAVRWATRTGSEEESGARDGGTAARSCGARRWRGRRGSGARRA